MPIQGFFEKRRILYEKDAAAKVAAGEACLSDGYPDDALDLFELAGDDERVLAMASRAAEQGDPFLLMRIEKINASPLADDYWDRAMRRASETGRASLAALARRYLAARSFS